MSETSDQRFAGLETRLAFQDRLIEELNASVLEAHREIEKCRVQIRMLEQKLEEHASGAGSLPILDQKPPHY